MPPTIVQISVSRGGMPKHAVLSARITRRGIEGDRQRNLKYHGGPDRAVCLYSEEWYADLRAEGFDVGPGQLGENLTTRGVDLHRLAKGSRLRIGTPSAGTDAGGCVIEVTDIRVPCRQLKQWGATLPLAIVGRSGWVGRVIEEGTIKPGDLIEVLLS